ncbi:hypothetical protein PISMIDRAFT_678346 [Pisolithus microcarpus 441]|uniref:Uncharacterized protein n=1 Tax=Pisolithus microcarpus 441 TaxID=765257 RepID=A0A0C9ZEW9_9AGAM|nr:hypothetical protein PISMIDRAFT_678346 [Pisolithus microcarpus 441]
MLHQPGNAVRIANRDTKPRSYPHGGQDPETRKLFECPRPFSFHITLRTKHRPTVERRTHYSAFFPAPENITLHLPIDVLKKSGRDRCWIFMVHRIMH